ncbi:MAG: AbrB/MazE/SpoVT family DNA-binding domain-containing protein [Candidatus Bathyarchaeia archaeon]
MIKSRVGSKGELFPPKEIREKIGLKAHKRVIYKIEDGCLVVEPVPDLEELLMEPPLAELNLEEFHSFRKELSKRAEA